MGHIKDLIIHTCPDIYIYYMHFHSSLIFVGNTGTYQSVGAWESDLMAVLYSLACKYQTWVSETINCFAKLSRLNFGILAFWHQYLIPEPNVIKLFTDVNYGFL